MSFFTSTPRFELLQWCLAHAPIFEDQGAAIGLSPAETEALTAATEAFAAALAEQNAVETRLRSLTALTAGAQREMARRASIAVQSVRAFAAASAEPAAVYKAASIAPPAAGSRLPPPGTPTRFTFNLQQGGILTLEWKCPQPRGSSGVTYEIRRSVDNGPLAAAGISGRRRFADGGLPAGCSRVCYEVTALRSTARGNPAFYEIQLGGRIATSTITRAPSATGTRSALEALRT